MPEPKSLQEMMRIMDVASTLRREREAASAQLDLDETKALLREKLKDAAVVTGERITDAEIEAAIDQYYGTLYRYEDPAPSLARFLAHTWVRRWAVLAWTALVAAVIWLVWWLFFAVSGPFSAEGARLREVAEQQRLERQAQVDAENQRAVAEKRRKQLMAGVRDDYQRIQAVAKEQDARDEADGLFSRFDALVDPSLAAVEPISQEMKLLRHALEEEFVVRIVNRPGENSGIIGYVGNTDTVSGHYVIVEAIGPQGIALTRKIRDGESGQDFEVRKWGEQVPQAVFERIANDKRADGIVDDNVFARKRTGYRTIDVVMLGADGRPLTRGRQITKL